MAQAKQNLAHNGCGDDYRIDLHEGDLTIANVFMADGARVLNSTIDSVAKATADRIAVAEHQKALSEALHSAIGCIDHWAKTTPSVKKIAGAVGSSAKIRVLIITHGEYFSEAASDALEQLSSDVHALVRSTPFRFRFYLEPESCEEAAIHTFLGTQNVAQPDDSQAAETHS